jgi:hypothetical protein
MRTSMPPLRPQTIRAGRGQAAARCARDNYTRRQATFAAAAVRRFVVSKFEQSIEQFTLLRFLLRLTVDGHRLVSVNESVTRRYHGMSTDAK